MKVRAHCTKLHYFFQNKFGPFKVVRQKNHSVWSTECLQSGQFDPVIYEFMLRVKNEIPKKVSQNAKLNVKFHSKFKFCIYCSKSLKYHNQDKVFLHFIDKW